MPLGAFRLNSLAKLQAAAEPSFDRPIEVTSIGGASVSTASSKFGGASYLGGLNKRLEAAMLPPTGDFTIEWWANQTNRSAQSGQWQFKAGSHDILLRSGEIGGQIRNIGLLIYDESGTIILNWASPGGTLPDNTWTYIAVTYVASNTTFRVYMNSTQRLEQSVPTFTMPDTTTFRIGSAIISGTDRSMRGYLDELRVSNIARYTGASVTVPTAAFTNDANTALLLHMDGANGSTVFTDDNS